MLSVKLNISITEEHKSLSALESIDSDLMLSLITKYISEIDKDEIELRMFTPFIIKRLENLLTDIVNDFGQLNTERLIQMAHAFHNVNISEIKETIVTIKTKIKSIPSFLTKEDISLASSKYLEYYFENKNFNFINEARDYIKNVIVDYNFETERKISSDIYWIYNQIRTGDTVKKVTKKGETQGIVKQTENNNFIVISGDGEYQLTSAWNKLTTHLNFSEIASDVFILSSRLHYVTTLLKKGPTKAEIIKLRVKYNNDYAISLPIILSLSPIDNLMFRQLVFRDIEANNTEQFISFYNLLIDYKIDSISSDDELLDCFIYEKVLQEMI